jgi:hypothetical protein
LGYTTVNAGVVDEDYLQITDDDVKAGCGFEGTDN